MPNTTPSDNAPAAKEVEYSDLHRGEMLERTQWAREFSWHQLQVLARHMRTFEAENGTLLFREGDRGSYMCLIARGKASVVKGDQSYGMKYLATLGPGKTFGEMALFDAEPRSASVVATEKTLLLVLTKEGFEALAAEMPQLALRLVMKLARMMSERLRKTSGALSEHLERIDK